MTAIVMLRALWNDESGVILSTELVLVATILVIGVVAGLSAIRDAVVTEMSDLGAAISRMDQSFQIRGVIGRSSFTAGSEFTDVLEDLEDSRRVDQPAGLRVGQAVNPLLRQP